MALVNVNLNIREKEDPSVVIDTASGLLEHKEANNIIDLACELVLAVSEADVGERSEESLNKVFALLQEAIVDSGMTELTEVEDLTLSVV